MPERKLVVIKKQIHQMIIGEYGHISHQELRLDENNYPWLNILGFVFPENRFVIKVSVTRIDESKVSVGADYSIDMLVEETSDILHDNADYLKKQGKYAPITKFKLSLSNSDNPSNDFGRTSDSGRTEPFHLTESELDEILGNDPQGQIDKAFSSIQRPTLDLDRILSPFNSVFFPSELLDEVLIKLGVPDLLHWEIPKFPGVILRGPPGTGKSVLQRAVADVYKNMGAYSHECNLSAMTDKWVGSLGKNIDEAFKIAIKEAKERNMTSFLYFDEGTTLTLSMDADNTLRRYYQEALDTLKKYIGNYRDVVVCISTNEDSSLFDQALVREGRLAVIDVGYPKLEERRRMWDYFITKHKIIEGLSDVDYNTLATMVPENIAGSFIEEFCRSYISGRKHRLMKEMGADTVLAGLKRGLRIDDDQARDGLSFDNFRYASCADFLHSR